MSYGDLCFYVGFLLALVLWHLLCVCVVCVWGALKGFNCGLINESTLFEED